MRLLIRLFILILIGSCNSDNEFNLCSGKTHPYYHPTLEYKGDFYEIKRHFYENYRSVDGINNSGIVKIRFHINCLGESGNYNVQTYSLEYDLNIFNPRITEQLVDLTKKLKKWIPARDEEGNLVDSHKFFAFKIIDGHLKDILPK